MAEIRWFWQFLGARLAPMIALRNNNQRCPCRPHSMPPVTDNVPCINIGEGRFIVGDLLVSMLTLASLPGRRLA